MPLTNCHIHVFTADHVPDRYAGLASPLIRRRPIRLALLPILKIVDPTPRDRLERYAHILEMSYRGSQAKVFERVRLIYPPDTRFVVLPMDMTHMGAGTLAKSIHEQHKELRRLRDEHPDAVVPFAAVDPRHEGVVAKTKGLIENDGFRGIKLYPPLGYYPADERLEPLYAYAEDRGIPVLSHCSRYGAYFRGRISPITGKRLWWLRREKIFTKLADPALFRPVLDAHPRLKLCLAHFGGQGEWDKYLRGDGEDNWLGTIIKMITSGSYENLYTDVSYTLWAGEEYVHLLNELLDDARLRRRVLYGSDFYVVEDADIGERTGLARLRSVLGEERFHAIAVANPNSYLGGALETPADDA